MTISLSEQLEGDIKAYLHKTFGTYFSSLDERFAADIKEDVINASDFHHGYYNDDDISIAFQRVTLGRMGHPDWQIYHSCTDTEVNIFISQMNKSSEPPPLIWRSFFAAVAKSSLPPAERNGLPETIASPSAATSGTIMPRSGAVTLSASCSGFITSAIQRR